MVPERVPPATWACSAAGKIIATINKIDAKSPDDATA
jgi:hypothetical protein